MSFIRAIRTEESGLSNNAYTNIMAAWVFCRALDVLETAAGTTPAGDAGKSGSVDRGTGTLAGYQPENADCFS